MRSAFGVILLFFIGSAQAFTVNVDSSYRAAFVFLGDAGGADDYYDSNSVGSWDATASLADSGGLVTAVVDSSLTPGAGEYSNYIISMDGNASYNGALVADTVSVIQNIVSLTFSQAVNYVATCDSVSGFVTTYNIDGDIGYPSGCGFSGTLAAGSHDLAFDFSIVSLDGSAYSADLNNFQLAFTAAVPVPAAVWLFGSGLGLLGWFRRRETA